MGAILLPYTIALIMGGALLVADLFVNGGNGSPPIYLAAAAAAFIPISCMWSLSRAALAGGPAAVRQQPAWRRWGAASILIAGVAQIFGLVDRLSTYPNDPSPFPPLPLAWAALAGGWPLLILVAHLFYEASQPEGL
jgi:hypothetical protein